MQYLTHLPSLLKIFLLIVNCDFGYPPEWYHLVACVENMITPGSNTQYILKFNSHTEKYIVLDNTWA